MSVIRILLSAAVLGALAVAALVALPPAPFTRAQPAQAFDDVQTYQMKYAGKDRIFGLYVPRSFGTRGRSMIVALHGRFSSAKALHAISRLQAVAEARGAILLYPQNTGSFWADGGHTPLGRKEPAPDDPGFIGALTKTIAADHDIDRDQIFLLGYDGGGTMAYRVACAPPVRFAAVAIVSALMWDFTLNTCPPARTPTPILIVHGRDSELFPAAGQPAAAPISANRLSAAETIAFWRGTNGCTAAATATGPDNGVVYANCPAPVAYVGLPKGRQDWPHTGNAYQLNRHELDGAAAVDAFFFNRAAFVLPRAQSAYADTRDYLLYVPHTYDARKPTPLMIMLHGRPSSASEMARISDMNTTAARHGFIVAYPEGINHEWNAQFDLYTKSRQSVHTGGNERVGLTQDDVGFLKTLTKDLGVDLNIDTSRMYIAGFSNGGFMTMRMACTESNTFAGFAEVGSSIYPVMTNVCKTGRPAPMIFIHGTEDKSVPIDGVRRRGSEDSFPVRVTLSAKEMVGLFARRNGCKETGSMTSFAESGRSPGTRVTLYTPKDCSPQAPIAFYIIEGGGHTWPGVPGVLDHLGLTNMDMSASEEIWRFLSPHRLPPPQAASTASPPRS